MNIVVLRGSLPRNPERRELSSGGDILQFDLVTELESGSNTTVPVSWFDAPEEPALTEGVEVVVVGSVRRRFFRAGGSTQSRTEVVADAVTPASQRRTVAKRLAAAAERISGA